MEPDVSVLFDLSWHSMAARVMQTAVKLEVFTHLSQGPMSAEQVSQKCKTKPDVTEKLLAACTAMGLLAKRAGLYDNSQLSRTYLVRGGKLYQGDMIAHQASLRNFWNSLSESIMLGAPSQAGRPGEHRDFIMGMHNIAVAGRAQLFLEAVDLTGRKRLFDVGGGPGTYSIEACKRYPQLTAIVFDLPETIEIAKQVIADEGMQDRVTVRPGSWDSDDFGGDNDVVLLSDVMHGPASNAVMKLKKAYDSMVDGGLLVIQEFLLNNEGTGPLIPALFNIMVGAFRESELLSVIRQANFSEPKVLSNNEKIGAAWITACK